MATLIGRVSLLAATVAFLAVTGAFSRALASSEQSASPNSIDIISSRSDDTRPSRSIRLTFSPRAIAVDSTGKIYVAGSRLISIFGSDAHGTSRPLATISGSRTGLHDPNALWIGPNRRLFVAEPNAIAVFGSDAMANQVPERLIKGRRARVSSYPLGLVVDSRGFIYVADSDGIEVYAPASNGDTSPAIIISRPGFKVAAETIDSHDNLYVIDEPFNGKLENANSRISIYKTGSASTRKRTQTLLLGNDDSSASWLAADKSGSIYVTWAFQPWPVTVYSSLKRGAMKPVRSMTAFFGPSRLVHVAAAMDRSGNIFECSFGEDHYRLGPLRLLMSRNAIVKKLGPGTAAKYCYSAGNCIDELRYTDGRDTLNLEDPGLQPSIGLLNVGIERGVHGKGIAPLKSGVGPISAWRWEGVPIFAVPPTEIFGWGVCDGGWHDRGYCGATEPDPRGLLINFVIRGGKVSKVLFGME